MGVSAVKAIDPEKACAERNMDSASAVSPEEESRAAWQSTINHSLFFVAVVGLSILVWGVVVYRVRNTAILKPGDDGTNPTFTIAGAVCGWTSMVIYSKCFLASESRLR